MARSLLDQLVQIAGTGTYNSSVSNATTVGVAESASNTLESDLNVMRTLLKGVKGTTNWYDAPTMTTNVIAAKQFIQRYHSAAMDSVSVVTGATVSTALDVSLKALDTDNGWTAAAGNSTTSGIVVNSSRATKINLRDATTENAINDGNGNMVYATLSYSTDYTLTFYSDVAGTPTAYTFPSDMTITIAYIPVSRKFSELSWDSFQDFGFHDVAGISGSISDENIVTNNPALSGLLTGLNTQEAVNTKVDALGLTTNGNGAYLVGVVDLAGLYSATNVEGALAEVMTLAQSAAGVEKVTEVVGVGGISSGAAHTLPSSANYTMASGANMDVYVNGQLQYQGSGNDYTETSTTSITFLYNIRQNSVITYIIRK